MRRAVLNVHLTDSGTGASPGVYRDPAAVLLPWDQLWGAKLGVSLLIAAGGGKTRGKTSNAYIS